MTDNQLITQKASVPATLNDAAEVIEAMRQLEAKADQEKFDCFRKMGSALKWAHAQFANRRGDSFGKWIAENTRLTRRTADRRRNAYEAYLVLVNADIDVLPEDITLCTALLEAAFDPKKPKQTSPKVIELWQRSLVECDEEPTAKDIKSIAAGSKKKAKAKKPAPSDIDEGAVISFIEHLPAAKRKALLARLGDAA